MDMVHEAAAVLNGIHDFKAFTHVSSLVEKPPTYSTLRSMEITVEPGTGFLSSYMPPFADQFDYWNFVFKSRSFLYRQASQCFFAHRHFCTNRQADPFSFIAVSLQTGKPLLICM